MLQLSSLPVWLGGALVFPVPAQKGKPFPLPWLGVAGHGAGRSLQMNPRSLLSLSGIPHALSPLVRCCGSRLARSASSPWHLGGVGPMALWCWLTGKLLAPLAFPLLPPESYIRYTEGRCT